MKQGKDGWLELSPEQDMSEAQRGAYEHMKALYAEYKAARDDYEAAMLVLAPKGKTLVFGYNFGKASIKVVEASEKRERKQAKPTVTLADFLADMASGGRAS